MKKDIFIEDEWEEGGTHAVSSLFSWLLSLISTSKTLGSSNNKLISCIWDYSIRTSYFPSKFHYVTPFPTLPNLKSRAMINDSIKTYRICCPSSTSSSMRMSSVIFIVNVVFFPNIYVVFPISEKYRFSE